MIFIRKATEADLATVLELIQELNKKQKSNSKREDRD